MTDPFQLIPLGITKLQLKDLLHFIELQEFTDDWNDYGLSDEDLLQLQIHIMQHGALAPVIPGTGGLRKIRFSPSAWEQGKRGGLRICFALYPRFHTVVLVYAYAKNVQENLSAQAKFALKEFTKQVEIELERLNNLKNRRKS